MKKIEEEMVKAISGKAPELANLFKGSNHGDPNVPGALGAISEEVEDMEDEDDDKDDLDDEDLDEDMEDEDEEDDSSKRKIIDIEDDDLESDDANEDVFSESDQVQVKAPKHVKCEEDDDFVNMFDKMMKESLYETKAAEVPKSQQMDIVAPVHSRQNKKVYGN